MNADDRRRSTAQSNFRTNHWLRICGERCAFAVSNVLGVGFLEKVYENALVHELRKTGLAVTQQHGMTVRYDDVIVGEYVADILAEHSVLVELKHARPSTKSTWHNA